MRKKSAESLLFQKLILRPAPIFWGTLLNENEYLNCNDVLVRAQTGLGVVASDNRPFVVHKSDVAPEKVV